jgi:hypothetical protein
MAMIPLQGKRRLIKIIILIILASHIIPMLIYCLFHLARPLTLMGKIIHFGVIKFIWEVVENGMHFDSNDNPYSSMSKSIKMPKLLLFC